MLTAAIAAPKISFDTVAMISFSADGFVIGAQMVGLCRRKLHHASCIAREGAADCAKY
jgi:hypothetical protein